MSESLRPQPPSGEEIADLFKRCRVAISDARLAGQSADGAFVHAYTAGFVLVKAVVRAGGYRVTGADNHRETIQLARAFLGRDADDALNALELGRRQRNASMYDEAGLVDDQDVRDLLESVSELERLVRQWLVAEHPDLLGE